MKRSDGRAHDALRAVRLVPDFTENPLGSVLCQMGRTMVPSPYTTRVGCGFVNDP